MKRIILLSALFSLSVLRINAQETDDKHKKVALVDNRPPCQRNPDLPSFNIMLPDSATFFNTSGIPEGKKTVFIIFGPECSHCRDFFRKFFIGIDSFSNIDFYLVTPIRNLVPLRSFYNEFNLSGYKNIKIVGRDNDFFSMDYFGIRQFPSIILYDEHKKFVKGFDSESAIRELRN